MDKPWYQRTEFWALVGTFGYTVLQQTGAIDATAASELIKAATSPEASMVVVQEVIDKAASTSWGRMVTLVAAPVAYIIGRSYLKAKTLVAPAPTQ